MICRWLYKRRATRVFGRFIPQQKIYEILDPLTKWESFSYYCLVRSTGYSSRPSCQRSTRCKRFKRRFAMRSVMLQILWGRSAAFATRRRIQLRTIFIGELEPKTDKGPNAFAGDTKSSKNHLSGNATNQGLDDLARSASISLHPNRH